MVLRGGASCRCEQAGQIGEPFPKTDASDYNWPTEGREVLHRVHFTRLRSAAGFVCFLRLFSITFLRSRSGIRLLGLIKTRPSIVSNKSPNRNHFHLMDQHQCTQQRSRKSGKGIRV